MLPPARHLPKTDPDTLIHDIEDDSISQFVWTIAPKISQGIRKLVDIVGTPADHMHINNTASANRSQHEPLL